MNLLQSRSGRGASLAALVIMALSAALWAQSPPELFSAAATPTKAQPGNTHAMRESYVKVDWKAFAGGNRPDQVTQLLNLNLFDDARFLAERIKLNWLGPNRFDWIGQIGNDDVVLSVRDGNMVGTIQNGPRVWEIRSVDGFTHQISEINTQAFDGMDWAEPEPETKPADIPVTPVPANAPLTMIDVMVYYNQGVVTKNPNMEAYLGSLIALSNRAYERSGVPQEIRMVYHRPATTCNTNNGNSCNNTDPATVADRKKYGADLTGLIFDGSASYCGVSNGSCCMTTIYSCALSNKSFPHEFGHNMGAGHDAAQGGGSGYAHGWINTTKKWRTIMAYPCSGVSGGCPRIDNFSSPLIMYNGDPTGVAESADNARRMRERMAAVAAREPTVVPVNINRKVIVDPKADFSISGLSGGSLKLHVARAEKLVISVFTLGGKRSELTRGEFQPGDHQVSWQSRGLAPGVNILHIRGRSGQKTYKLTVMR